MSVYSNRLKWIEALESGEYKCFTGAMARIGPYGDPVGHCCLGVATVVYANLMGSSVEYPDPCGWVSCDGESATITTDAGVSEGEALPFAIAEFFGLDEGTAHYYATLNDENGTFPISKIREDTEALNNGRYPIALIREALDA